MVDAGWLGFEEACCVWIEEEEGFVCCRRTGPWEIVEPDCGKRLRRIVLECVGGGSVVEACRVIPPREGTREFIPKWCVWKLTWKRKMGGEKLCFVYFPWSLYKRPPCLAQSYFSIGVFFALASK